MKKMQQILKQDRPREKLQVENPERVQQVELAKGVAAC